MKKRFVADLAYLMGAILHGSAASGNYCEWPDDRPFVEFLDRHFPRSHKVWQYVHVVTE